MRPEEVRITQLDEDGYTACASLKSHPKFEQWKDEFHPGEMWSVFGEQWVTDKQVATP
jgi:hypothetical protein